MSAPVVDPTVVTAAYAAQQAASRANVLAYLAALWARLTSYRTPDAEAFAAQVAPIVTGAQQHTASLTAAYLSQVVALGGGVPPTSVPIGAVDDAALRGVPTVEVYQRPFKQIWYDLSQGKPLDQAVTSAGKRLNDLAVTDLQLAKTHTSQKVLEQSGKVTGYQRVLNGDHSCALCVLASGRTYHKTDLMPIHPGCDCGTAPLFDGARAPDPTGDLHNLIADQFGEKYVNAGGRFSNAKTDQKSSVYGKTGARDYRNILVVHEHSELGPVLGVRGQNFQGPTGLH